MDWRREHLSRGMAREARESMYMHERAAQVAVEMVEPDLEGTVEITLPRDHYTGNEVLMAAAPSPEVEKEGGEIDIYDEGNAAPPHDPTGLHKTFLFFRKIVHWDNETKRILHLAVPFSLSAVAGTIADLVILALISHYLGTDAMIAFTMVDIIVGISASFMGGWVEAISSLVSMAFGAENYELAGQYVQTACVGYALGEIPMAFVWGFSIRNIILLMGFPDSVADLSQEFVWVKVASNMMEGLNECVLDFLEVIEKEAYANAIYCLSSMVEVCLVLLFVSKFDATLVIVGLVGLVNETMFFFINVLIPNKMGWLRKYEIGLFGRCSCRNTPVLKEVFHVALPLAFGSVLAYAEWEILTVFAATLGPAEAATWAILGFVWDVFESTTEAIGDAGEVRCAYQLGKGRSEMAKLSAYKSMFLATLLSLAVTAIFLGVSSFLPGWLTHDETIQSMLAELFPLIALGNITMNMGMVCWALVGAQGRYRLATSIAIGCSIFITVPIAAIVTLWLRIDLQGLTFAVVIGYTVTAMLLSTSLLMSDWDGLAEKIQEKVAAEEESDSDDDSDDGSSSSDSEKSATGYDTHQESPKLSSYIKVSSTPVEGYSEVLPNSPGGTQDVKQTSPSPQEFLPHRSGSPPYLPGTSRPRSPPALSGPVTGNKSPSSPRSPTRRPRVASGSITPDRKQAKSLAKLRSLGTQHAELSLPNTPGPPKAPSTPGSWFDSPGTPNTSPSSSPHRVVKGRRRRIH
eukprot:CAMPEP_0181115382 /NCGR_PEP_ID=MMETSP1071-20121207/21402_1 /TAXON_ID=35127 /ORGANISM="Thalassiosira sp., Strain NH16" /LENGTH=743 /DNA_ID=CAMNT_0023199585 /DNA_START=430 /DNA_END=2661 /DNA_ORIENTATION=-